MPQVPETMIPASGQSGFSNAVRHPDVVTPKGLVGPDGQASEKRFSVYRNNVMSSLIDALGANFPAIQRLIGEDDFVVLARQFIIENPPEAPILIYYGSNFAAFLDKFEPLAEYPYLGDVARVEFAWLQSYHAADRDIMSAEKLSEVDAEKVGTVKFEVHPASWVFRSRWPAATLVSRNREDSDCSDIDLSVGEDVLITRPRLDVDMRIMPAGGYEFINALVSGVTLEEAAGAALAVTSDFDLPGQIAGMLECGIFCDLKS